MHESVLRAFFQGSASSAELRADLAATVNVYGEIGEYNIADMDTDVDVDPSHLVLVCEAVLRGELQPAALQAIGFCLLASDHFHWDGDTVDGARVYETTSDWSCPKINYPLTLDNIRKFRDRLVSGRDVLKSGNGGDGELR
jgi:hypothetical protein